MKIILLGGSNACGNGFSDHPWLYHQKKAASLHRAGLSGVYATRFTTWLSAEARGCCPGGHNFTNLCAGGAGTSYILDTFDESRLDHADLILVDTAPNDLNTFVHTILRNDTVGAHKGESVS